MEENVKENIPAFYNEKEQISAYFVQINAPNKIQSAELKKM